MKRQKFGVSLWNLKSLFKLLTTIKSAVYFINKVDNYLNSLM